MKDIPVGLLRPGHLVAGIWPEPRVYSRQEQIIPYSVRVVSVDGDEKVMDSRKLVSVANDADVPAHPPRAVALAQEGDVSHDSTKEVRMRTVFIEKAGRRSLTPEKALEEAKTQVPELAGFGLIVVPDSVTMRQARKKLDRDDIQSECVHCYSIKGSGESKQGFLFAWSG